MLLLFYYCEFCTLYRSLTHTHTRQGLKLTTSRRPGDVIHCHWDDKYCISGRSRDDQNFGWLDFQFFHTLIYLWRPTKVFFLFFFFKKKFFLKKFIFQKQLFFEKKYFSKKIIFWKIIFFEKNYFLKKKIKKKKIFKKKKYF